MKIVQNSFIHNSYIHNLYILCIDIVHWKHILQLSL
jgi:hypothetical protein